MKNLIIEHYPLFVLAFFVVATGLLILINPKYVLVGENETEGK